MKFDKKELREIIDCIDFINDHFRFLDKLYERREDRKYEFGYLNYMVSLRNKIVEELNKKGE